MSRDPAAKGIDASRLFLEFSNANLALMPDASGKAFDMVAEDKLVAKVSTDAAHSDPTSSKFAVAISTALGYQAVVTKVDGERIEIQGFQPALSVGRQGLVLGDTASSDWLVANKLAPIAVVDIKSVEDTKANVTLTPLDAKKSVKLGDKVLLPFVN